MTPNHFWWFDYGFDEKIERVRYGPEAVDDHIHGHRVVNPASYIADGESLLFLGRRHHNLPVLDYLMVGCANDAVTVRLWQWMAHASSSDYEILGECVHALLMSPFFQQVVERKVQVDKTF